MTLSDKAAAAWILLGSSVVGSISLAAAALYAAEPAKPAAPPATAAAREIPLFSALDVNADTAISADEAKAHAALSAIFAECDADKNGALSTWEFAEARSKLDK